jgi:3-oxoacid CoA-transferase B subunit
MSKSMEPQDIIARRIARELKSGMLVNLGIGIPTLVANHVPNSMHGFFQSENGMIGIGAPPSKGMAHPTLTDAGGRPVTDCLGPAHSIARCRSASFAAGISTSPCSADCGWTSADTWPTG